MGATGRTPAPAAPQPVSRWLLAEAVGEDAAAETALGEVLAALPRPRLDAGFADRVLARIAAEPPPWALERAAVWLLLVCGAALAAGRLWLPVVWERLEPQAWITLAASAVGRLGDVVAVLGAALGAVVKVAHWLALAGTTPPVLTLLALCGLLAALAGRLLFPLLEQRSSAHVQA